MNYKQHPLSAAFPLPTPAEFEALKHDIATVGQRHPIIIFDGMVLDGWTRYRAKVELEQEPIFAPYTGSDPAGYVLSSNLHRRHLSASQRAGAIVACNEWRSDGQRGAEKLCNVAELPQTSAQMAETAQVSTRTIDSAKAAHSAGLGEIVRDGKASASAAADLAKYNPEAAQRVAVEQDFESARVAIKQAFANARSARCPDAEKLAELQAEKSKLEATLADKNAEIIALELAGVDEGARNEAMDKMQGYIDAIDNAERMRKAAEALLSEANYKAGELMRANSSLDAQNKKLKARIAELEKCAK